MAHSKTLGQTYREFSALLRSTREKKGWSQLELAKHSHVALRTIVNVESVKNVRKIRFDVVVRLAHSLDQSPHQWLKSAGHGDNISNDMIGEVLKKSGVSDFYGQEEPMQFFQCLESRLRNAAPVVVCIVYRTFSNFNHQAFLAKHIAPLMDTGNLFLALVCPYPKITDIDRVKKQTLSRIYFQVRSEVIGTTKEIKAAVTNPKFRSHVAAFSPKEKCENVVPPPMGLSEFRPILIQSHSQAAKAPVYELSGWLTFLHDQKERWVHVYPVPEKMRQYEDLFLKMCAAWKEYLSEISNHCDCKAGGWKKADADLGIWDLANVDMQV